MSTLKTHRFPATVHWEADRLVRVELDGKGGLRVATPPEFRGLHPSAWSPEDMLVGSAATCYALTFFAVAERLRVPVHKLEVDAVGLVERGREGRFRFSVIELDVGLETDDAALERTDRAAALAKEHCLVGNSLDTPIHVRLHAKAARPAEESVAA